MPLLKATGRERKPPAFKTNPRNLCPTRGIFLYNGTGQDGMGAVLNLILGSLAELKDCVRRTT